ncbi:Cof-type HAD-IIB family hydrolase [Paenibacillus silviterrae]|uniref:Cof-type HAD-IIB family hydrolase n=1 Tax=Paenibacillus silviterrae TaxID=3242194 RepID=UPI0032B26558
MAMAKYRLLALDLDGTTLTDDKRITEHTRRRIYEAVDAGVTVIFSTGRGLQTAGLLWDELGLNAPMVLLNGAELWKGPKQVWERNYLSREEVRQLHAIAARVNAGFWGYSVECLTGDKDWTDAMFDLDWMKFGIRHDDPDVLNELRDQVRALGTLEITASASINMEISKLGITKEYGVRRVCEYLGIEMDEVMAIGDHQNDLKLIRAAGFGVAMGNAEDVIKLAADAVTTSNEQDGVATAIERYLLG